MRTQLWLVLLLVPLAALPAHAQETRGNISGTVQDATGVVPGATITITNVDTRQAQRLTTNGRGYFEAPLLNPGKYEVTVAMPGFKTVNQRDIVLSVGQAVTLNLKLEVGQITNASMSRRSRRSSTRIPCLPGRISTRRRSRTCRCSRTCRSWWPGFRPG